MLSRSSLNQVAYHYNYPTYYSMSGIDVNSDGTKLVTVSNYNSKICLHTITGTSLGSCQTVGSGNWGLSNGDVRYPVDAAFDSNDNIFVNDSSNSRLQKFDATGTYVTKYGSFSYSSPFRWPWGLGVSPDNKVYSADLNNNDVYEFNNNLTSYTRIGTPKSRMSIAKEAIKKIVQDPELTSGANFGLMEWGFYWSNYLKLRVPINSNGAATIYTDVDGVNAGGGTYLLQAMNYARNYWRGNLNQSGTRYPSPIIPGATCQLNFNILISDGQWNSHSSAMGVVRDMKNSLNVKTFAVGLAINTGNRSNYDSLATNGGTTTALYADSSGSLLTALKDAILQAISGSLTFTTPAVMSDIQRGNFIYQSTFKYSKHKQWEGSLKKYQLNSNGSFGSEQWDAGTQLNNTSPNSRKIWTIDINKRNNTNNFTTSNRTALKPKLFPLKVNPTDAETDQLINFIRGFDSYDTDGDNSTTDERHKLADVYNSELIVVGKPDAPSTNNGNSNFEKTDAFYRQQNQYDNFKNSNDCGGSCQSRTEVVIAGANSGILHAFKTENGKELWGYIPPNLIGKINNIITTKTNSTNPIYGVDGSPVVKDIYFDDTPNNGADDPRWRTVLISGLGAGGNGYFALDITDINNPKHLFAIENDTFNKEIRHWNSDENLNSYFYTSGNKPPPQFDYSKLGCSHHCYNDASILSHFNNSQVFIPGSDIEFKELFKSAYKKNKINYFKLTDNDHGFQFNKNDIKIGKGIIVYPGTNLTICVIGAQLKNVLKAREKLKEKKISAEIIYFPSLKPFDKNIVIKSVKKTQKIITVEELSAHDGLFNQCIKSLAGRKFKYKQIAIKDFIHEYGTYEELCNITGLSARNIIHQSLKLFN